VQSALHQHARAAERDRFVNLLSDFVERAHVGVGRAGAPVKSTEGADYVADVRVIDVAVNDVSDNLIRVPALPNFIGSDAEASNLVRFEQRGAFFGRHALTRQHSIENTLYLARHRS
jgi:hypothetical protein